MPIDASRGTAIWEFNQFRSDVLSNLMRDLENRELDGLVEEQCNQVKIALSRINDIADQADDRSFWKRNIKKHFQKLHDLYVEWNGHEGNTPEIIRKRRKDFKKLSECRSTASFKWGQKQIVFANEMDADMVDGLYKAFIEFCSAYPDIFRNTRKAIYRVRRKKD